MAQRVHHQGIAQRSYIEDMQRMHDHYASTLSSGSLAPHRGYVDPWIHFAQYPFEWGPMTNFPPSPGGEGTFTTKMGDLFGILGPSSHTPQPPLGDQAPHDSHMS